MTTSSHPIPVGDLLSGDADRSSGVPATSGDRTVVEVRRPCAGVAVVVVRGVEDVEVLVSAAGKLRSLALPERVVVDLSEVTLVDPAVVQVLASTLGGPSEAGRRLLLVCRRLSGRRLLREWSGDSVEVFRNTVDALRTLTLRGDDRRTEQQATPGRRAWRAARFNPRVTTALRA